MLTRHLLCRGFAALTLALITLPAAAQTFMVQCPTSTLLHPNAATSAAGEPASTPRKFGSWPPVDRAPFKTEVEPSGAVSSSWMWNLLIAVFIVWALSRGRERRDRALSGRGILASAIRYFAYH